MENNKNINYSHQNLHYSKMLNDALNYSGNSININQELEYSKKSNENNENKIDLKITIRNTEDDINNEYVKINILKSIDKLPNIIIQIIPSYFYYLQINEEQYEKIKKEQNLLFNFTKFQNYIMNLLNKCKNNKENNFSCIIKRKQNENLFVIEEKTEYKKLNHITLKIEQINDVFSNFNENKENYNILLEENNKLKQENKELKGKIEKFEYQFKNNPFNINLISYETNKEEINISNNEKINKEIETKYQKNEIPENTIKILNSPNIYGNKLLNSYDQLNMYKSEINKLRKEIYDLKNQQLDLKKNNQNLLNQLKISNDSYDKIKQEKDLLNKQTKSNVNKIKALENLNSRLNNTIHSQLEDINQEKNILDKNKNEVIKIDNERMEKILKEKDNKINQKQLIIYNQTLIINELRKECEKKEKEIIKLQNEIININNKKREEKDAFLKRNISQKNNPIILNDNIYNNYIKKNQNINNEKKNNILTINLNNINTNLEETIHNTIFSNYQEKLIYESKNENPVIISKNIDNKKRNNTEQKYINKNKESNKNNNRKYILK